MAMLHRAVDAFLRGNFCCKSQPIPEAGLSEFLFLVNWKGEISIEAASPL
jgi:hypothetical protein